MKIILPLFVIIILSGCVNNYKEFYHSSIDIKTLKNIEKIESDQEPKLTEVSDLKQEVRRLRAKHYVVIGYSSFNGKYEDRKNAIEQAKSIGASIVLVNSKYSNTQSTTSAFVLPGRNTFQANTVIPYTSHQRRFDQNAVYLVKSKRKMKYGINIANLTPEQRTKHGRNSGVLITTVFEDTPAFYANIVTGDVLIGVNGNSVNNEKQAKKELIKLEESNFSILTIIRNENKKDIRVNFDKQ
jgi:hypothetical protein